METQDSISLRFLGPLDVTVNGELVRPGGPKQRALLCLLVLHAGEPLSIGAIVEAVWGPDAPDGAIRSLRTYISNLRKLFGSAADLHGAQGTYRLDLRSVETDVDRFRTAVEEASDLDDPDQRRSLLSAALDLWRGPFLVDIDQPWVGGGVFDLGVGAGESRFRVGGGDDRRRSSWRCDSDPRACGG